MLLVSLSDLFHLACHFYFNKCFRVGQEAHQAEADLHSTRREQHLTLADTAHQPRGHGDEAWALRETLPEAEERARPLQLSAPTCAITGAQAVPVIFQKAGTTLRVERGIVSSLCQG